MSETTSSQEPAPEKLKLLKSPLSNDLDKRDELATGLQQAIGPEAIRHLGYAKDANPVLLRNSQATNLETFYDLFLAACISLFNKNQQVNAADAVSTYVGFFSLIWSTWLLTSMYDVRFVTDSVFERCARAVHMGVLVGFVTTSPNFETQDQKPVVFQTFSIILMASRLCIALQYGVILWHTRKYKVTFQPLTIMIVINIMAAAVYLGISFRFQHGNSRVFGVWYGVGVAEIILTVGLSVYYQVLSFCGTHLVSRISLLTLIIFGEGVAQVCGKITDIVKVGSHAEWTPTTIGVVTAGVGISYIIFMLYFDWMPTWEISERRQLAWSLLHFPLHLSMTLFVEGIAQLVLYWKCVENMAKARAAIDEKYWQIFDDDGEWATVWPKVAEFMTDQVDAFSVQYAPTYSNTFEVINSTIESLRALDPAEAEETNLSYARYAINAIFVCLENSLYQKYDVDFFEDTVKELEKNQTLISDDWYNNAVAAEYDHGTRLRERFQTVFQYTFICGGIFFAFSTLLYIVARRKKWSPWAVSGVFMNFVLSLGIGLLAIIGKTTNTVITPESYMDEFFEAGTKPTAYDTFVRSPGVLPMLLGVYVLVLFVTHMMGDGPRFSFFKTWKSRERAASPAQEDGHVQQVHVHAETKYDPGAHVVGDRQQVPYDPYAGQRQYQPSARPYSILRTADPVQYQQQPQGYVQQVYPQQTYQQYQQPQQHPPEGYTAVYEYSGNDGPRQP